LSTLVSRSCADLRTGGMPEVEAPAIRSGDTAEKYFK
jgi:hypothetical protein